MLPCQIDATSESMHNLQMLSKDVLQILLCSIHPCPCFHLWPVVACHYHALKLLNNISVNLLLVYSVFPCEQLVFYASYDHVLSMSSCTNMPSCCWLYSHAIICFMLSSPSLQTCLLVDVSTMSSKFHQVCEFVIICNLAMMF